MSPNQNSALSKTKKEYLRCILTRTGIHKRQVILAITTPTQVKDLHRFLGMV